MTKDTHIDIIFSEITTENGLFCQFDDLHGVLLLDVKNPFTEDDFQTISSIIDPHFKERGELRGVIIHSKKFPYWKGAVNRAQYINFARENHYKFRKAALGMGGFFTQIVAKIAQGRVHPQVRIFKYNQIEQAQDWVLKKK